MFLRKCKYERNVSKSGEKCRCTATTSWDKPQTGLDTMQRLFGLLLLPIFGLMLFMPGSLRASSKTATSTAAHAVPHTDAQIDAAIRTKLAKSKIGKDGFKFHVQHGVVTWEGTTNVVQHKGSATRMARTAGATQVVNNIQISASAKAKAAANLKKASVVE